VTRHVRLREFLVGVEGLALLRGLFTGRDDDGARRIAEVRRILIGAEAEKFAPGIDVPELDVRDAYARWSTTYDGPGNPLIAVEQPIVWGLLDDQSPGRALDAACGTGGAAFFRDAAGESGVARGHPHSFADYVDAVTAAGLELRRCIEGTFGPNEVEMQQPAWALVPEATTAAYLDFPAAIVWDLRKP
jgi:hypothetical protein